MYGISRWNGHKKGNSMSIKLRQAEERDAAILYEWANDTLTRKYSFHTNSITWDEHIQWFNTKLLDNNSRIFIMEVEQEPVGQIRFDFRNENTIYISYAIAPRHRGKGYGTQLVKLGIETIKKMAQKRKINLIAEVKKDNIASCRIFEKHQFILIKSTDDCMTYGLTLEGH